MNREEKYLTLHLFKGIGNKRKKELLERFNYNIDEVLLFLKKELKKVQKFNEVEKALNSCEKKRILIVSIVNSIYPKRLKEIQDCPVCLFVKGRAELLKEEYMAFVGTRRATTYGLKATEYLISGLSNYRIGIASGFANGIDTAAHTIALKSGMPTVAVFGSGVDIVYPKNNEKLYEKMIEKGCIISEFPPGTKPEPFRFPVRNRIISGISLGVVVVEAREKSGSMITVNFALNQGREVFAVPGRIFDRASISTNLKIKNGEAKLVLSAEDIIDEFSFVAIYKKSDKFIELSDAFVEKFLSTPKSVEELINECGMGYSELITKLSMLEVEGKIVKNQYNQYMKRV